MKQQPTFSKKALSPAILTGVIAIVSTLVVILMFVTPRLVDLISGSGEQAGCQMSMLVSTTAEKATWGFGKEVPVECKTKRRSITQNDLARYTALASQAILKYPFDSEATKIFSDTQEGRDKWALAHIIANDMKSCYDRGWRGQLEIGSVPGVKGVVGGALGTLGEDYLCILCTRYTFDNYVSTIPNFPIKPWLQQNVIQDRTFYDYLKKNDDDQFARTNLARSYVTPREPLTVMFVADAKGQGAVMIAPYSKITSKIGEAMYYSNILATESIMKDQYGQETYYVGQTVVDKDSFSSWARALVGGPVGLVLNLFDAHPMNIVYGWKIPVKCRTVIGD